MQKNLPWKCFRTAFGHYDFPATSASQQAWRMCKRHHLLLSLCLVLWHSLIRSLYFIQVRSKFFIPVTFRPILSLFIHFPWHQFFLMLPREIFLVFLMTLLLGILLSFLISAVKGLIRTTFFFLTFIVLIQWNFPWNISTNLLIFTNKASSHVVIV